MTGRDSGGEQGGVTLTSGQLLRELQTFAFRNPRFREGDIDGVGFSLYEDDSEFHYCAADEKEELELDIEDAGVELGVEYSFKATRHYDDVGEPILTYKHSVTTKDYDAQLPDSIAEDIIGLPADEACEEAGKIMLARTIEFTIGSSNRGLHTCESMSYCDDEGYIISNVCTCPQHINDDPARLAPEGHDYGGMIDTMEPDAPSYNCDWSEAPAREMLIVDTPEKALAQWVTAAGVEAHELALKEFEYDENLKLAIGVLRRMQQLINELADAAVV